jgi:hypothetical protein
MSPNRWFPFEEHGARILGHDIGFPAAKPRVAKPVNTSDRHAPGYMRDYMRRRRIAQAKAEGRA